MALETSGTKIIGVPPLLKKLDNPQWAYGPMGAFLDRWRFYVRGETEENMTHGTDTQRFHWKGDSKDSIKSERDRDSIPVWARVYSNHDPVRWGEYGTGLLSEDPKSGKHAFFPPPDALEEWAVDHGFEEGGGYLVARAIFIKGGMAPHRFMRDAIDEGETHVPRFMRFMAADIEREAARNV
jgi:hypothetical protein